MSRSLKTSHSTELKLTGAHLEIMHDICRLLNQFTDHVKSTGCMARDKDKCNEIAERIVELTEVLCNI